MRQSLFRLIRLWCDSHQKQRPLCLKADIANQSFSVWTMLNWEDAAATGPAENVRYGSKADTRRISERTAGIEGGRPESGRSANDVVDGSPTTCGNHRGLSRKESHDG